MSITTSARDALARVPRHARRAAGRRLRRGARRLQRDDRPAARLVARAAGADDVARVIAYARESGLPLAVRGGGHNGAGLGTLDDGVVLDLGAIRGIDVDPLARTVRVGGGCTWGEVDRATHEHGLATPSGIIGTTGVGGLTLGGGLGHLTRRHGLAIDNLISAEVVLASGERVVASRDEHPDLFWALRGGGGNFGVVTSFEFRLHAVHTIFGGPTFWPVEQGAEVLSVYREFLPGAPRDLNGFFAYATVPPGDPFPAEIHLREVCGVVWCHTGTRPPPRATCSRCSTRCPSRSCTASSRCRTRSCRARSTALYPKGDQWYWRADFVRDIPDEAVALHQQWGERLPSMKSTMHLYPIDGAAQDVAPEDTAFSYRDANWGAVYAGVDPDPANVEEIGAWSRGYQEALHPYSAGGAYVNMMMEEGPDRVRASYRGNFDRLTCVKREYDPENLFSRTQNIPPADQPC